MELTQRVDHQTRIQELPNLSYHDWPTLAFKKVKFI